MKIASLVLSCVFALFLSSCGGGSIGTDGLGNKRILGVVQNSNGEPLAEVQITVEESGDSDVTDEAGNFLIPSTRVGNSATLLVESPDVQQRVILTNLTDGDSVVDLLLVVNESSSEVTLESITITLNEPGEESPENGTSDSFSSSSEEGVVPENSEEDSSGRAPSILRGTVVIDGVPVPGATVSLQGFGKKVITNAHGSFSFSSFQLGRRVTLAVSYEEVSGTIDIQGIPNRPVIITVIVALELEEEPLNINSTAQESAVVLDAINIKSRENE